MSPDDIVQTTGANLDLGYRARAASMRVTKIQNRQRPSVSLCTHAHLLEISLASSMKPEIGKDLGPPAMLPVAAPRKKVPNNKSPKAIYPLPSPELSSSWTRTTSPARNSSMSSSQSQSASIAGTPTPAAAPTLYVMLAIFCDAASPNRRRNPATNFAKSASPHHLQRFRFPGSLSRET